MAWRVLTVIRLVVIGNMLMVSRMTVHRHDCSSALMHLFDRHHARARGVSCTYQQCERSDERDLDRLKRHLTDLSRDFKYTP